MVQKEIFYLNLFSIIGLFAFYLFIRAKEHKSMFLTNLSEVFSIYAVPVIIFAMNLPLYISYKSNISLAFMSLILIPITNILIIKRITSKNKKYLEKYSSIIFKILLEKYPMITMKDIVIIFDSENKYIKIIMYSNDIPYDFNKIQLLKNDINTKTDCKIDLFIDKKKEIS